VPGVVYEIVYGKLHIVIKPSCGDCVIDQRRGAHRSPAHEKDCHRVSLFEHRHDLSPLDVLHWILDTANDKIAQAHEVVDVTNTLHRIAVGDVLENEQVVGVDPESQTIAWRSQSAWINALEFVDGPVEIR